MTEGGRTAAFLPAVQFEAGATRVTRDLLLWRATGTAISRSALLHIHSHGGFGWPDFSDVDLKSGREFVLGFFHSVPRMPHGMLALRALSAQTHGR